MSAKRLSLSQKKKKPSSSSDTAQDRAFDKGQSRPKHVTPTQLHKRPGKEDESLHARPSTTCHKDIFGINIDDDSLLRAMPFCDDDKWCL